MKLIFEVSSATTEEMLFKNPIEGFLSIGFGVFTFPEEYLCSDTSGDVSSINYAVDSTPVSSTTTSDPAFLTNSVQSPGVPLVNINN